VSGAASVRPADAEDLCELITDSAQKARPLEVRAGGSKRDIVAPGRETTIVDLGKFRGIVDYEPGELVLTVRPATPLAEVEELLRNHGQVLAFEPWDHGPVFGRPCGAATIGGVVAAGIAGPGRLSAGAVRDHLLGFKAISGRGEAFKAGGRVVKNVTGYDVPKLLAGSWGQLAVLTELTLKVAPLPRAAATIALQGLSPGAAIAAMSKATGSPHAIAAAAHRPATNSDRDVTAVRLEGFAESVDVRADRVRALLAEFGNTFRLADDAAESFWTGVRQGRPLHDAETIWRVHVAASRAAQLADELEKRGASWIFDWAGALIWAGAPAAVDIRAAAEPFAGHAMLLRAPLALRKTTPARHAETRPIGTLSARLKQAFDPSGILDPFRFA